MNWLKRIFSAKGSRVGESAPEQTLDALKTPPPQSVKPTRSKSRTSNDGRESVDLHAMRMARINSDTADAERLGIRYLYMHLSALSPTTRPTHAARHGHLYTEDEVQEWWSKDGNDVGCRCTVVQVLVDESGNPLTPSIVERARKTYETAKAKGDGDWTKD